MENKIINKNRKIFTIALILIVVIISILIISNTSTPVSADHDNDTSLEIYGWAFNVTNPNNLSEAIIWYNYTSLLNYTQNESNLDLYKYNYTSQNPPEWIATNAKQFKNLNLLKLNVTDFPSTYVLGESF